MDSILRTEFEQLKDKKWLEKEYIERKRSQVNIAREIGCAPWSVANALKRYNIERRKTGEQRTGEIRKSKYPELNDKELLIEHYINKNLDEHQIAKKFNIKSGGSVLQALAKFNIPIREPQFHRKAGTSLTYPKLNDIEWLREKYTIEKLSTVEISCLVPCPSAGDVYKALKRHNITVCTRSEGSLRKSKGDGFELNKETISVLTGCLLGDGGLKTNHENTWNPTFHKCNIFYDHIIYVAKKLFGERYIERVRGPIIQNGGVSTFRGKTYKNKPIFLLSSLTHPELMPMYKTWYPELNGFKKVIPKDIILNPTVLLHWFMDDGYSYITHKRYKNPKYNRNVHRLYFCTQSFNLEDLQFLSNRLLNELGLIIKPRLHQRHGVISGTGYEMELSETQIKKFYDLIGPCPVPNFGYKWNPKKVEKLS